MDSVKVAVLLLLQLQNLVGALLVRSSTPRSILDSLLKCKHTETGCVNCNAPADHIKSALRQVRHDCSCKGSEHDVYKQLKERNAACIAVYAAGLGVFTLKQAIEY